MKISIVAIALLLNVIAYCIFSLKTKSWLNILTPQFLLTMPVIFLFEFIHLSYNFEKGSDLGYLIVYLIYTLPLLAFVFSYLYVSPIKYLVNIKVDIESSIPVTLGFLILAVLLYSPILVQFAGDIFNPRAIYTATRTGFGLGYYGSVVLCYIFFILVLFNQKLNVRYKIAALLFSMFFAYLHGSKGQILTIIFIGMMYYIVNSMVRVKFFVIIAIFLLFGAFGASIFYSMSIGVEPKDLLLIMAGYSDYSRNAVMLIDVNNHLEFGRIFFEDNFFSRIPRAIYPDKPTDYGSFALALKYFPASFYLNEGVPSFGVGVLYADFGISAVFFSAMGGFLNGIVSRTLMARLRIYKNPADFILLCFMSGIILIPIGAGNLLPEHFMLAMLVLFLLKKRKPVLH